MLSFYQALVQSLQSDPAVLATVIHIQGSVPREVGAKLLITASGRQFGTIGGGAAEAKVIQAALRLLQAGNPQVVEIDLRGSPTDPNPTEGICGGTMKVWIERWQGSEALSLAEKILHAARTGDPLLWITPLHASTGSEPCPRIFLQPAHGSEEIGIQAEVLIERIQPMPTLLIVGAGHVGLALAEMAPLLDFQVIVIDERPEFADPTRFSQVRVIAAPFAQAWFEVQALPQLHVALVNRSYQQDVEALRILLTQPLAYVGMIGSRRRIRIIRDLLLEEGFTAKALDRLQAPIGLEIGALTPAEIAVSILAELIRIRRQKS